MDVKNFIQEVSEAIDAKDSDKFASYITPDGQFRFGNAPSLYGTEDIRNGVAQFFTMIKASRHELVNFWEGDNSIVWQGKVHYTRLDDKEVAIDFVNIFNMDGEKVKDYLIYIDNSPLFSE